MTVAAFCRDKAIDFASGVMIINMILHHIFNCFSRVHYPLDSVLFFFMPWFFYKSGLLVKDRAPFEEMKVSTHKLLIPYSVYMAIGAIVSFALGELDLFHPTSGNLPLWFLLSLFLIRVTYAVVRKSETLAWILWIGSLAFGFLQGAYSIGSSHIAHMSMGYVYFLLGAKLRTQKFTFWHRIMVGSLGLFFYFFAPVIVDMNTNRVLVGSYYLLWPVYSICGIVIFDILSGFVAERFSCIQSVGKSAAVCYVCHWPILLIVNRVLGCCEMSDFSMIAGEIVITCGALVAVCKLQKYKVFRVSVGA